MNTLNYPEIPAKKVYNTSRKKEKDTTEVNRTFYQQFHESCSYNPPKKFKLHHLPYIFH